MAEALTVFLIAFGSVYFVIILFALSYYFATMSGKKKVLPRTPIEDNFEEPFVSIIVPTYNEERNIATCLQSLKELEYSNYEIIVSDGGSTDRTTEIANAMVDKVIIDERLPEGWIGKNYGCHLGYCKAKGDYLLFVDADTEHMPESLKHFMKVALERNSALLSVFPFQRIKSWWEAINPVFYFASHLTYGGINSVNNPRKTNAHTASGQYMLFKREDYESFGGHEALKGSIVEDLALARTVKIKLKRLYFIDRSKLVYTRMYPDSAKQCYRGWKKCLYPGTKLTQPRRITGALMWFLWGLFSPAAIVLTAVYIPTWYSLLIVSLLHIFCVLAVFCYWHNRGNHQWITYVLFPIVDIAFCIMLLISAMELVISKKTTWRGRKYRPDLFVGSLYPDKANFVGDSNRLQQLDTDIEIELSDEILSQNIDVPRVRLSKKHKNISTDLEEFDEPVPLVETIIIQNGKK